MNRSKMKTSQAFIAVRKNDVERLESCLAQDVTPDSRDEDRLTLLMWAARKNSAACAAFLLEHGADVNAVDCCRSNALHHAAFFDGVDVARLLIAKGIDLKHRDNWGGSPLSAARGESPKVYLLVREEMVKRNIVLDESRCIIREWPIGIETLEQGIREEDLSLEQAAEVRRYAVREAFPKIE